MRGQRNVLRTLAATLITTAIAVPALAQPTGGASVATGAGTATASRVLTATATVTAIDMTMRQVTLRRADGSTFLVVADEQMRNLPQLRVGDTVVVDYYDRLTLELKKGGTGEAASPHRQRERIAGRTRPAAGRLGHPRDGNRCRRHRRQRSSPDRFAARPGGPGRRSAGQGSGAVPADCRGRPSAGDVRRGRRAFHHTGDRRWRRPPPLRGAGG